MCPSPAPLPPTTPPAPAAVRALVGEVLPQERHLRVEPVDEGGEHSTWWIGERYVLRLTLDRDAAVRQRREIALRDAIRPHVPVGVPVSVAAGDWAPGLAYTVDIRLPGDSAERRPVAPEGEHDLAGMLRGLHTLAPGTVSALGLPVREPRSMDAVRLAAKEALVRLAAEEHLVRLTPEEPLVGLVTEEALVGPTADDELATVRTAPHAPSATDLPTPASTTAVVLHNDLKGEHLLVSSAGRVRGLLDWADAVLGDPAEDVAGLALSIGTPAAGRVAVAAGLGPEVVRRGALLARYDTAIRLADRLDGRDDSPLPLLRAQLERAWER